MNTVATWVALLTAIVALTIASRLQADHTTMCHALAQTPGINYANTGCH